MATSRGAALKDGVQKEVLRVGTGRRPRYGEEVSIHFVGTYEEDGAEIMFNSSRVRKEPLRIALGKDQTIPGLETAVQDMLEGELARVRVPPEQAFGPAGNPHGFHGSGKPIPPSKDLIFEVELLTIDEKPMGDAFSSSPSEKLAMAITRKSEGVALFSKKSYSAAAAKWTASVSLLNQARAVPNGLNELDERSSAELLVVLHSNIAQVLLFQNDYENSLRHCQEAATYGDLNSKTLFRRAKARVGLKQFEEADEDFREALRKVPDNDEKRRQLIRKELEAVRPQVKEAKKASGEFWKGTFGKLEGDKAELYTNRDIQQILEDDKKSRMKKWYV